MQPVRMPTSREFEAMAAKMYVESVNGGKCPRCAGPIQGLRRASCCHNVVPCGHRVFGKMIPMWFELAVPIS